MCSMEKTSLVSCQLSFYPLNTTDTVSPIKTVIKIIERSGLHTEVNDMSTIIKGDGQKVLNILSDILKRMDEDKIGYTLIVTMSNVCGCEIS